MKLVMVWIIILLFVGFVAFALWARRSVKNSANAVIEFHKSQGIIAAGAQCPDEVCPNWGENPQCRSTGYLFTQGPLKGAFLVYSNLYEDKKNLGEVYTDRLISIYLPPAFSLDDNWLKQWQPLLQKQTKFPGRMLISAERAKVGGILLKWRVDMAFVKWVIAIMADVTSRLPAAAAQ